MAFLPEVTDNAGSPIGRTALVRHIDGLLNTGENVLLWGPPQVGKSALIHVLDRPGLVILDPFEGVHSQAAARIRRALTRGSVHLAAARVLDRQVLGAVRRIAFWFTPVRVPPLPNRWMKRLILHQWAMLGFEPGLLTAAWLRETIRLSRGLPGLGLAIAREAGMTYERRGRIPSPAAACIEARLELASVSAGPA